MPPFQTTTALKPAKGYPGMMANMEEWNAFTAFAEDVTANPIGFGQPVMKGTGADQVKKLAAGGVFAGITRANIDAGATATADGGRYGEGKSLGVADMGVIFVTAGAAITKGQKVYWVPSSGRYYGASATGRILLPNTEFDDNAAAAGDVVAVRLRITPGNDPVAAVA